MAKKPEVPKKQPATKKTVPQKTPRTVGRPTTYNRKTADIICALLAEGKSLREILVREGMPVMSTVFAWMRDNEEFSKQYARAKQESADALADDIQDIAHKTLRGIYEPQAARVAIDAFKWSASKLKPKKYGDKLDLTSDGKALPAPIYGGKSVQHPGEAGDA